MHKLGVTLEELYKGRTRKLAINREVSCSQCDGKGGSKVESCSACKGRGMKVMTKQIGPGMIQQMQSPCDKCEAKGEIVSDAHRCKTCHGKKTTKDKKIIEVSLFIHPAHKMSKYVQKLCFTPVGTRRSWNGQQS